MLFLAAGMLLFASLFVGTVEISAADVWAILTGNDVAKSSWKFIVLETRLPAALCAMLCGSSLAVSGLTVV